MGLIRNNRRRMSHQRQDRHGIRIDAALWDAMGTAARVDRRTRTAWAQTILAAATTGCVLSVPQSVAKRLERIAQREGTSPNTLAIRLLEECLTREEHRRRKDKA